MNIEYIQKKPSPKEYNELIESVGWGTWDEKIIEEALNNTLYSVCAYDGNKMVGMGRIIGDKTIFLYLHSIAVHPDYQGYKIGTSIIKELLKQVKEYKKVNPGIRTYLGAAKGKEEAYTLANNAARTETAEEAKKLDDKIISAWTGHPHFRIIDNSTEFEEKLERLLKEIASFLGEPEPFEIERKYLIYYPNIKELENMPNCTKVDIIQTYLKSIDDTERRVRARGIDGEYMYYLTEKRKVSDIKRVEVERRLTQDEYLKYLMEADNRLHPIHKTRYCLSENNQYFEIDIYPEWDKQAIMEIELSSEDDKVQIPSFIKVLKEVTDDDKYKNYSMAKEMPKQLVKRKTK